MRAKRFYFFCSLPLQSALQEFTRSPCATKIEIKYVCFSANHRTKIEGEKQPWLIFYFARLLTNDSLLDVGRCAAVDGHT